MKERLRFRHIVDASTYQVCGLESETIIHSLFECNDAQVIWALSPLVGLLLEEPVGTFTDRFEWVANHTSRDDLRMFCTLAWAA